MCYLCELKRIIYQKSIIMKPALVVLAAGMGSRYGGLKQLDALGPSGETIMDYSVFDAIRAGFGKVVFIIRKDFEDDFRRLVLKKYEGHVQTEVVFQSIMTCPRVSSARKTGPSLGVQTMQCLWLRMLSMSRSV